MPMTDEELAAPPRHPQLMDPADDPEELIVTSIWWYPACRGFSEVQCVTNRTFSRHGSSRLSGWRFIVPQV
jgi:hypothetical protein